MKYIIIPPPYYYYTKDNSVIMAPRYIFVQVKGNKNGTFTTEQLRTLDNTVFRDFKLEIKARGFDKGDYPQS